MRLAVTMSAAVCGCCLSVASASQSRPDVAALMTQIAERVSAYYQQALGVICVNESTVQPVESGLSPAGFARTVESELRVETDWIDGMPRPEATVLRTVLRVNGRDPRPQDQKNRAGCTDPNPLSPEPLAFLLPSHRDEYRFTSVRDVREHGRAELLIDFVSSARKSKLELIEDPRGHDDCFDWTGPLATRGRLWVDANTHEVLRVDRRIEGPTDVRVPQLLQRRYNFQPWVVLDRDDLTMRFKQVVFTDPDEVLLLPESIDALTMMRGGLQSMRRTETFRNYRRFLTTSRILKRAK